MVSFLSLSFMKGLITEHPHSSFNHLCLLLAQDKQILQSITQAGAGTANTGRWDSHYTIHTSKGEMINSLCQLPKSSRIIFKCRKYFSRVLVFSASGLHPPSLVCQAVPPLIYSSRNSVPSMSSGCQCHQAFPVPRHLAYRRKLFTCLYATCKTNYFQLFASITLFCYQGLVGKCEGQRGGRLYLRKKNHKPADCDTGYHRQ